MTTSILREMSNTNIKDVDISRLVNIESVTIDAKQDVFVRARDI